MTFSGIAEELSLRLGFLLNIYRDSRILKSKILFSLPITLKFSKVNHKLQISEWERMDEGSGLVKGRPVRNDLPWCCETLLYNALLVEPIYDASHDAQLNKYTTEDWQPTGMQSLNLKKDPILKLLTKMIFASM